MKYIICVFSVFCVFLFSCSEPPQNIGSVKEEEIQKKRQKFDKNLKGAYQVDAEQGEEPYKSKKSLEDIFVYKAPSHWTREASTPFRLFNFSFGQTGEVFLNFSQGSSGGLLANVNRWRQQMGLEKIEDVEKHSQVITFFNRPSKYLDLEGDYKPVRGDVKKNWRMLGVLFVNEAFSFFLKMTGHKDEIAKEKQNFEAFCRSFSVKAEEQKNNNRSHGKHEGLDLHFPHTWQVEKKAGGIIYLSAIKGQAKLTISRLNGTGGGVEPNYNRWCRQLGLEKSPNYQDFEKVQVLNELYPMIHISGDYRGMGKDVKIPKATLLGFIIPTKEETIFIKLIAPTEAISTTLINEFKKIVQTMHF